MHIVIFGRGKFAQLIASELRNRISRGSRISYTLTSDLPLGDMAGNHGRTVVVHVGSGKKLGGLIAECNERHLPIIQAATGISWGEISSPLNTPIIESPNLELGIVALFDVLPDLGVRLQKISAKCHITESHQASKTSVPGTAVKFADSLGVPHERIVSVRDPSTQLSLGVPQDHLNAHGHHLISITTAGGATIEIRTKVNGRKPYVPGLLQIAEKILGSNGNLQRGLIPVEQFMFG